MLAARPQGRAVPRPRAEAVAGWPASGGHASGRPGPRGAAGV